MATIDIALTGADHFSISSSVIIREPLGIRKVRVIDNFGIDFTASEFDCSITGIVEVHEIPRDRCPFTVEVTTCNNEITSIYGPYFSRGRDAAVPMPCDPLRCEEDEACNEAIANYNNVLNEMSDLCHNIHDKKQEFEIYRNNSIIFLISGIFYAALAIIVLATTLGTGVGLSVIAAVLSAIFLGLAIYYGTEANRVGREISALRREMSQLQRKADDLAAIIRANCCPGCYSGVIVRFVCTA